MQLIGRVFSVLVTSSFVFSLFGGRMNELSAAVLDGAEEAVRLSISLLGMMCLWSGVIKVLEHAGVTAWISRLVRPILRFIYPAAYKNNCGIDEISANFAANLLGMGNAALPLGLCAMKKLSLLPGNNDGAANADMKTFAVLATVPLQLLPTTLIALRSAADSVKPYEIIIPIYICSAATIVFAVFICRFVAAIEEALTRRKKHE